ncbi:MAG: acetate--CoA ligase [Chloroflexi bacterium]|nr:acetate--CoA ligase [Chloroflexota bacterium]MBL7061477.1 acetate--CoA ligase [Dehalococcoidia bacterium]
MVSTSFPSESVYWPFKKYTDMYNQSIQDPERFWSEEARKLDWFKTWDTVLEWEPPFARWFAGGKINASYQCVDRHVKTWRRSKVAIYWEGELGDSQVLSYSTLYRWVNKFASVLQNLGVNKGDTVALYLPMIPELPIFMLACARIGAPHTVVFSGFSAQALADRINDIKAKVLVTADAGFRRGKHLELKSISDEAVRLSPSIEKVVVARRAGIAANMKPGRDFWLHELLDDASSFVPAEPVESTHPLYILYTSGTTGKPKGIVHGTGGYLVFTNSGYEWVFNVKEESVYWCTADVGWVTGHSSIVYGPLCHGAAIVLYEGAPDYPSVDRWWDIVEKYGVSIFYTSPTGIRMLMKYGEDVVKKHDLSSLELLGSVGEAINPEAWEWYYRVIGGERCPIVDTWWQTETGGTMISPTPGIELVPLKPGSATFPLPGVNADIFDDSGKSVPPGEKGYLVIKSPWPGMLTGIHGDPQRYQEAYWSKFPGMFYTGDYAIRDKDGYFWLLGRADEVLKIAGHRIGTIEIEDATVSHEAVVEAAVASRPDPVKGESVVIFVTLKQGVESSPELKSKIKQHIRQTLGPVVTPDEIYIVAKLPKTRSGKIMRRVLKAIASGTKIGDLTTLEDEASVEEVKKAFEELQKKA